MDTVKCAHPAPPVGRGVPWAWKAVGDGRRHCLVKFRARGDRAVLGELPCSRPAGLFDPPLLEPALIAVGGGPMAQINAVRERGGLAPIEAGAHYGVKFTAPFLAAASPAGAGADLAADRAHNLDAVPGILGFCTLVQNHGRHCGNTGAGPSAFGTGCPCRIFGLGHAFGCPAWAADSVKRAYRAPAPVLTLCLVAGRVEGPGGSGRLFRALESRLERWLDGFAGALPPGLVPDARAAAEALKSALVALKKGVLEEAVKAGVLQR